MRIYLTFGRSIISRLHYQLALLPRVVGEGLVTSVHQRIHQHQVGLLDADDSSHQPLLVCFLHPQAGGLVSMPQKKRTSEVFLKDLEYFTRVEFF